MVIRLIVCIFFKSLSTIHCLYEEVDITAKELLNTQVQIYLLSCEGGIFSAHALTLVGTKVTPYKGLTL